MPIDAIGEVHEIRAFRALAAGVEEQLRQLRSRLGGRSRLGDVVVVEVPVRRSPERPERLLLIGVERRAPGCFGPAVDEADRRELLVCHIHKAQAAQRRLKRQMRQCAGDALGIASESLFEQFTATEYR